MRLAPAIDLGNVTETEVTNLQPGNVYVFAVTALDTGGQESERSIEVSPPNGVPVAVDDTTTTPGASTLTIDLAHNDHDPDNGLDPSSLKIVEGPRHGSISINSDGTITYTPRSVDTFSYTIQDASGAVSNTATVTITFENTTVAP